MYKNSKWLNLFIGIPEASNEDNLGTRRAFTILAALLLVYSCYNFKFQ